MITLSQFNNKKIYCSSPYVVDRLYHHIKCFDLEKILFVNNLKQTFSEHEKHYTHFEFQVLFSRKTKSYYLNIFKCKKNSSRSLIKESKKVVFNSKITSFRDDIYDDLYRNRYYKRSTWQGNYNYSDQYYRKICFLKKKNVI